MFEPEYVEGIILDVLALEPGPATTDEVCARLRARLQHRFGEDDVSCYLSDMQKAGKTTITPDYRWKALVSPPSSARDTRATDPLVAPELVGGRRALKPSAPSGRVSSVQTSNSRQAEPAALPHRETGPRWETFRRLCRYYGDCIREGEAPNLQVYPERENISWIGGPSSIQWERLASGQQLGFSLSVSSTQMDFVKNGKSKSNGEALFLCYPCEVVRPKDKDKSPFIKPVLIWPLGASWSVDSVRCASDGPFTAHGSWLSGETRDRQAMRDFLHLSGLETEEDEEVPFTEVVGRLGKLLDKRLREPLNANQLTRWPGQLEELEPGIYNWPLLVQGRRLKYTLGTLRELRALEQIPDHELDQTALRYFYGPDALAEPKTSSSQPDNQTQGTRPERDLAIAELKVLNPSQRESVLATLHEPVTVITGPPGTGKSEVVRTIMANQAIRGASTLFASKNHQAIAAVVPALNRYADGGVLVENPGAKDAASIFSWKELIQKLLSRPQRPDDDRFARRVSDWRTALELERSVLDELHERKRLGDVAAETSEAFDLAMAKLPPSWRPETRIREGSIDPPADVAALRGQHIRVYAKPSGLWARILAWLRKRTIAAEREALVERVEPWPRHHLVGRSLQAIWMDGPTEMVDSEWSFWADLSEAASVLALRDVMEADLRALRPQDDVATDLQAARVRVEGLNQKLLNGIARGEHHRLPSETKTQLTNLRAAASNFGVARIRRELAEYLPPLLKVHPLWAITSMSVGSKFPLSPGLFDLLVMDEASQCDIATTLPLLFRARRVAVVGDPMQLAHVSQLKDAREEAMLRQHGLTDLELQRFTFKANSLYQVIDAAPATPEAHLLRTHYRCHPSIAEFVNQSFYADQLHVATEGRKWLKTSSHKSGCHWTHVEGFIESRSFKQHSLPEIEVVLAEVKQLESEEYLGSIGIVAPFRHQADRIRDRVEQEISESFRDGANLRVGTADAFQGDERDLIIYSLCAGPDLGFKAGFAAKDNRFNVAVTRARSVLHVIGNLKWALEDSGSPPHVRALARRCSSSEVDVIEQDSKYESPWEEKLDCALKAAGITTVPQYPIAGRRLDLAVIANGVKIDVEVDGEAYHKTASGHRKDDDVWRDHQLRSLGWKVCRFWVYQLREDMNGCVERVNALIGEGNHDG